MSDLTVQNNNIANPVLQMIERVALDPQSDVAKLEKMIELQERVMSRQAKEQFDLAMLSFQMEKPLIEKVSQGHNTKYAKLEHMQNKVDPILRKFGLFARWTTQATSDNKTRVTCIITHVGGHSETSSMDVVPDKGGAKSDIQACGSSISYAQRYTFRSILGLVISEENDGNVSSPITEHQVKIIERKLSYLGEDAKQKMIAHIGCEINEIEKNQFQRWCNALDSSIKKKDSE